MIFYQILSTKSWSKCMEISLENLNLDTGAFSSDGTDSC